VSAADGDLDDLICDSRHEDLQTRLDAILYILYIAEEDKRRGFMVTESLSLSSTTNDHMPFAFEQSSRWNLVFCRSTPQYRVFKRYVLRDRDSAWKLHWSFPLVPASGRLSTGLAEEDIECSPSVCSVDDELQLSFIGCLISAGAVKSYPTRNGFAHRLFSMRGRDLTSLGKAIPVSDEECYCGFSRPDLTIVSDGKDGTARFTGRAKGTLTTTFDRMSRITFCFDEPSRLIITGEVGTQEPLTVLYDFGEDQTLGQLELGGMRLYKPTIWGGKIAFPPSPAINRDGTSVRYTDRYELLPTSIKVTRSDR
jgi:hypothetical protein